MSLVTRCPSCATAFKVVRDQLRLSDGWVRCGRCGEVFDAQSDLREQLPDGGWVVLAGPSSPKALPGTGPDMDAAGEGAPASSDHEGASPPAHEDQMGGVSSPAAQGASSTAPAWPSVDWLELSPGSAAAPAPVGERVEPAMPPPDWLDVGHPEADAPRTDPEAAAPLSRSAETPAPARPAADPAQVGRVLRRGRAWTNAEPTALAAFLRPGRSAAAARPGALEPSLDATSPLASAGPARVAKGDLAASGPSPGEPAEDTEAGSVTSPSHPAAESEVPQAGPAEAAIEPSDPDASAQESKAAKPPLVPLRPSFMDTPDAPEQGAPSRRRFWLWSLAGGLLVLALGGQVLRHERDQWALSRPALLPLLTAVCRATDCTIAPPRRIDDIRVDGSTLMRDGAEGRYRLVFTLRNAAPVAVAMPAIELSLLDGSERPVLRRVVQPAEMARADMLPGRTEEEVILALELHAAAGRPLPSVAGHSVLAFYP